MKSKAVSIKCKILSSLLIVSILSSFIIYIFFNLVAAPDIEMYIKNELLTSTNRIQEKYNENKHNKYMNSEETFKNLIELLSSEINNSKLLSGIHIALFNSSSEVIYPYDKFVSVLTDELLNEVFTSIDFEAESKSNNILKMNSNDNVYYASVIRTDIYENDYLLLYLSKDIIKALLKPINYTLILILSITTLVFIVISYFIAKTLSKPINQLSNITQDIANGHYTPLETDYNIKEISELNENINLMVNKLKGYHSAQKIAFQNASHELRTPLMSIQGYAEAIKYDVFDDINKPTDIIIAESKKLTMIVESLLVLSKLDTYEYQLNLTNINLYNILNDYSNTVMGIAYKENLDILINCPKNINIYTDEYLLSRAMLNLLSNCIRYAHNTIIISVEIDKEYVTIKVCDDGNGFDEDDLKIMFTRFYKGKSGKFGLGLSIAKSAINYINGEISANNNDNIGAQFTIKLPLRGQ